MNIADQPITWGDLIVSVLISLAAWGLWDIVSYCVKYWRHPPRE